jgi:hypothetical protein
VTGQHERGHLVTDLGVGQRAAVLIPRPEQHVQQVSRRPVRMAVGAAGRDQAAGRPLDALGGAPDPAGGRPHHPSGGRTPRDGQQRGQGNRLLPHADRPAQLIGITGQVRAE